MAKWCINEGKTLKVFLMIVFALLQFSPSLLFEVLMKSHSAVTQNEGSLCQNGKGEEQKIVSPSDCCCCCTSKEPKQQKIVFVDKTLPQLLTFTCQLLWTIVVSVEAFYLSTIHNSALHVWLSTDREPSHIFLHAQHLIKSKLVCLQRRFNLYTILFLNV